MAPAPASPVDHTPATCSVAAASGGDAGPRLPGVVRRTLEHRAVLPAVLVLALVLRVAHLVALHRTVWFDHLDLDPAAFDAWGRRIAAGDWGGSLPFFVDPLYPYVLGIVFAVVGHSLLTVRLLQVAIGVATVGLVGRLGRSAYGRAEGNAAALVYACYGPAIFSELEVEKTPYAAFLLVAAVASVLSRRRAGPAAAGVLLGLAALSRGNLVVLVLPFALLVARDGVRWSLRRAWPFAAALTVVLAPVAWANHHAGGGFGLTTSAGQNLYQGNNPYNTAGSYGALPFVRATPEFEEADWRAEAERRTGLRLDAGEVSGYWARQTLRHAASRPGFAATMLARKALLVVNDYEVPDNQDYALVARWSPVLRWSPLGFGWLLPFAAVGAVATIRSRAARLLATVVAFHLASVVVFFVVGRFRLPVLGPVVLLAIVGVRTIVTCLARARYRPRPAILATAALVGLFVVCFLPLGFHDRRTNAALAWRNLGALQAGTGAFDDATRAYERGLELAPSSALLQAELGLVRIAAGDAEGAVRHLAEAARLEPDSGDVAVALAQAYEQAGQVDRALEEYARASALDPGNPDLQAEADRVRRSRASCEAARSCP